jgi:hypothetical protein
MAKMTFEFLDVGMGDGTLVKMVGGKKDAKPQLALIDFGVHRLTKFKVGKNDAMKFLVDTIDEISKERKEDEPYLDHLFITHPHADHYNAIKDLITAKYTSYPGKALSIGRLTYGGPKNLYSGDLIGFIKKFVVTGNVNKLGPWFHSPVAADGSVAPFCTFGDDDDIKVYLLNSNAPLKKAKDDYNQLSLCLMFADVSGNKVILMGDAGNDIEKQIIKHYKDAKGDFLKAYALKLGHHGSDTATSNEWIEVVRPKAVFASGDMVWAHPYCNAISRAAKTVDDMPGKHWFCCGKSLGGGKRDYFNHEVNTQIFLNIWYFVTKPGGEWMVDDDGEEELGKVGLTFGVQWQMNFDGPEPPTFFYTDVPNPAPPKK